MTELQARDAIKEVLHRIAPEADLDQVPPDADLRQELDIDSMDILNFAIGLEELTGVTIPESDYRQVATLRGCTAYLVQRAA
jgi:acyl carrier protein